MGKLIYLGALAMLGALFLATPAMAQNPTCDQVRERLNAGNSGLTPAELLSCGLSPEAIGQGPSIGGPFGVGTNNVCSALPQGSPESVACFEELIANMGGGQQPQPQPIEQTMPKEMPKTGGPAVGSLLPVSALLIRSGIVAFAVLRRR